MTTAHETDTPSTRVLDRFVPQRTMLLMTLPPGRRTGRGPVHIAVAGPVAPSRQGH